MCWKCSNPHATDADYLTMIHGVIASHGWFVQFVGGDRLRPPFAYTVGLTPIGHPELLVTGLPLEKSGHFLNYVAHQLAHGADAYVAGQLHLWPPAVAVEVVDVAEPTVHLVMAEGIYGPEVRAVQLVYTDDRGKWPWQTGFRGDQPVLGPRANDWTLP